MQLFDYTREIIDEAEAIAARGCGLASVLPMLRTLSLDHFGLLLISMPNTEFPHLSEVLPKMADPDVQRRLTGKEGIDLYVTTAAFARQLETCFVRYVGKPLQGATILDFGVGYGRNLRSMLYFSEPDRLWGIDAWQRSLDSAIHDGVPGILKKSDPMPDSLPVGEETFDLIFSSSVFTHLSAAAADACLQAMRKCINPDGVCVLTIRPVEFWSLSKHRMNPETISSMVQEHNRNGFAYTPAPSSDGTYGDASMRFDYLNRCGWSVAGYDATLIDPYLVAAILRPS